MQKFLRVTLHSGSPFHTSHGSKPWEWNSPADCLCTHRWWCRWPHRVQLEQTGCNPGAETHMTHVACFSWHSLKCTQRMAPYGSCDLCPMRRDILVGG